MTCSRTSRRFSFSNIDRFSTSSLVTRLTTDTNNVQQAYMMLIRTAIRAPMMIVFAIIMAFITGGSMAVIYVIVAVVLGFFLFYIGHQGHAHLPAHLQKV